MATATLTNILRLRGRLVAAPTDLAAAFPHGGTELGLTRSAIFKYGVITTEITAEEYGGHITEATYQAESAMFAGVLRDYDRDAVNRIFAQTAAGGGDGAVRRVFHNATHGGILLSSRSIVLLFAPVAGNATTGHPHILMYNAVPMPDAVAELQLSAGVEAGVAFAFRCIPDATERIYNIGRRGDLTL